MVDGRDRVLPQLRLGDPRAQVTADRAHVAVQQLVPRLGERVGQLLGVVQPSPRDIGVDRGLPQRDVGHQHRRGPPCTAERVGDRARTRAVLGGELPRPGRALGQLPFVAVQRLQEAVVPLRRGGRPDHLEAAGDRILARTGAVRALPAQPLLFDRGALRLGAHQVGVTGAVGLAEAVPADDQRGGLLVVHRHPAERLADVDRRGDRIGLALRAFGVDVDQAHGRRAVGLRELALTRVALVGAQPFLLFSPEDLFGLPDVLAAEAEAKGLEAHRLQGHVARVGDQVGPGDLVAVLLLDRPQQPAGLVQARVVRPAVQRGEALHALAGAAAAVVDAVGARGVPAHPDEQSAVVAVVGGPPVLRRGHQRDHVGLERLDVELGELRGVIEVVAERVGQRRVRVQRRDVDLVGPPVPVGQRGMRLRLG